MSVSGHCCLLPVRPPAAKFAAGSCPSVFTHMVRLYREPAVQANAREEYWQSLEMRADLHRRGRIASRASVTGDGLPKAPVQPRVVIQARPYSARAPLVVLPPTVAPTLHHERAQTARPRTSPRFSGVESRPFVPPRDDDVAVDTRHSISRARGAHFEHSNRSAHQHELRPWSATDFANASRGKSLFPAELEDDPITMGIVRARHAATLAQARRAHGMTLGLSGSIRRQGLHLPSGHQQASPRSSLASSAPRAPGVDHPSAPPAASSQASSRRVSPTPNDEEAELVSKHTRFSPPVPGQWVQPPSVADAVTAVESPPRVSPVKKSTKTR